MGITRKKRKVNKLILFMILSIIVILVVIFFALIYKNKMATIETFSFSETQDISLTFTNIEKENINSVLQSLYVEDNNYFGFSGNSNVSVDLYTANSVVNLANIFPSYDLSVVKEEMTFLSDSNIENFDFLNLTYFIELCNSLDIGIDYAQINKEMKKFYDEEINLFFIDSVNDSINIKIIATALVKKVLGDNLSKEFFSPEKGIQEIYENYKFLTENDITLFNSGGDILYCMSVFHMNSVIDKSELNNWYIYWNNIYEATTINSDMSALQYSEFLNIARIFEPDYSAKKVQNYYNDLTVDNIKNIEDLSVLCNILQKVEILDNTEVNQAIETLLSSVINSDTFISSEIDIKSTAFGVMLAQKTDFSLNYEKLKNYIGDNYSNNVLIENTYDRTSALYYNLVLDQLVNGYEQKYNSAYFQSQIDEILKELDYDQSIAADIVSTRRIVELVSDLKIFDAEVKLTIAQKNRIKKGLMKALENRTITNSVLLNDIFIVDKILNLNIVSNEKLLDVYVSLTTNGGTCAANDTALIPDICSTYQFMTTLNRMNNYNYLEQQKSFVETQKLNEGVYTLENNSFDLSVITYGNAIRCLELGGDKDD